MKTTIAATLVLLLSGCSFLGPKMGNVTPQSGGIYQVTAEGKTEVVAMKSALFSAETTCKARQMRHVVASQKTQYKGMVSETTNKVLDMLPLVSLSSDDDYQISLSFTCEA